MYHNNIHAADVVQSLAALLSEAETCAELSPIERLAVLVAAVAHDLGHPGVNNDFLVKEPIWGSGEIPRQKRERKHASEARI
mmetsp:Transcript_1543/g.4465  ORF Transcript_1543/g.4465 Transcript_1543/m.4465 type:complete len:82 (+) Transcript_1543:932-1177(+)